MYSLQGFTPEYVQQIYKNVVAYSIKNYQNLPDNYKQLMENRYKNALELKDKLGITDEVNYDLLSILKQQRFEMEKVKEENQPVIDEISKQVLAILKQEMPIDLTEYEKCEYIFDYVTNTMSYSNEWYEYCSSVPPTSAYDFDFYKGVPLSKTYEGLLVTRQGTCEDIANLIVYLGRQLGVNIEKENCYFNNNAHAINYLMVNNRKSFIDATSVVRNLKSRENACLVSKEELDQNFEYAFKHKSSSILVEKKQVKYDIIKIIEKVNAIMPTINYIESEKLEK